MTDVPRIQLKMDADARRRWKRPCEMCQQLFLKANGRQRYCGSLTQKTGCSWKHSQLRRRNWRVTTGLLRTRRQARAYRQKNLERVRLRDREKAREPERQRTLKEYRAANKDKVIAWQRKWRAKKVLEDPKYFSRKTAESQKRRHERLQRGPEEIRQLPPPTGGGSGQEDQKRDNPLPLRD